MAQRDFNFNLYRLIIHDENLLEFMGSVIRTNAEIAQVVKAACSPAFDYRQETKKAGYLWSLRGFVDLESNDYPETYSFAVTLAKATFQREGMVVNPEGFHLGISQAEPPLADVITLIFQMNRHLVAVEAKSGVTNSDSWLTAFHEVVRSAALQLHFRSTIELQPKPEKSEVLRTFLSFQKLTRLKIHLVLPNPDLSRLTKNLFTELQEGGIREFLADMRNPNGLSQSELTLPHAAASMGEDGYKKDEVLMEGIRDGKRQSVKSGTRPTAGRVDGMLDFVRGLGTNAKTKEGKQIADAVIREIERISSSE